MADIKRLSWRDAHGGRVERRRDDDDCDYSGRDELLSGGTERTQDWRPPRFGADNNMRAVEHTKILP